MDTRTIYIGDMVHFTHTLSQGQMEHDLKCHFFGGKWDRDTGQNGILQQTHMQVIYWECFDEFTSARSVLRELGMPNVSASMVVRMNNGLKESQIVQSY